MKLMLGLDKQVEKLIAQKQKEFQCLIFLSEESEKVYMGIFIDGKMHEVQLISESTNKDSICVGIMKWFRSHN